MRKNTPQWMVRSLLALFLFPAFTACVIDELKAPEWDVDIFGPLAKTSGRVSDFLVLDQTSFDVSMSLASFGIPDDAGTVPCAIIQAADFSLENQTIDYELEYGSVTFGNPTAVEMTVANNLSFGIQTLQMTVRSSDGSVLIDPSFATAIASGATASLEIDLSGKTFSSPLSYDVTFQPQSCEATDTFPVSGSDNLSATISLTTITIDQVSLKPNLASSEFVEDASINLQGDEVNTPDVSGTIDVLFSNQLAVDLTFSVEFLDPGSGLPLATLFSQQTAKGGQATRISSQTIDNAYYDLIKGADKVRTTFQLMSETGGTISGSDSIGIQFIGDIQVNVASE